MQFEFHAGRILFGSGSAERLEALIGGFGSHPLVVTGSNPARATQLFSKTPAIFSLAGEPTLQSIREGVARARQANCDCIVGFGGGSALDAAKAIGCLTTNSGESLDYLEVIGRGLPIPNRGLPIIAVPTTAGTGAEVTKNAVLGSPEHGLKASLRGPTLLPAPAVVDPTLSLTLSKENTATTGLDALTQLLEAFVSSKAGPLTDALCRDGLLRVRQSLVAAYNDGSNAGAREGMSYASLLSGLALANAGLGVVHGFAAPLGGLLKASHGAICAAVLPAGTAANVAALRARQPHHPALAKYAEAAQLLAGTPKAGPDDLITWLRQLTAQLQVQSLSQLGLIEATIGELVDKAARANSMKANPLPLTAEELEGVARSSM